MQQIELIQRYLSGRHELNLLIERLLSVMAFNA